MIQNGSKKIYTRPSNILKWVHIYTGTINNIPIKHLIKVMNQSYDYLEEYNTSQDIENDNEAKLINEFLFQE